jgi:hypothetical protein
MLLYICSETELGSEVSNEGSLSDLEDEETQGIHEVILEGTDDREIDGEQ